MLEVLFQTGVIHSILQCIRYLRGCIFSAPSFFYDKKASVRVSRMKKNNNTLVIVLFFLTGFLSCKYDSTINKPSGAVNVSIVNIVLDGRPFSYTYTNASVSPQI